MGGGGGGGGGGLKPPDFKLILLCVQAVTAKEHPKFVIIKKREEKTAFTLLRIQKSKLRSWIYFALAPHAIFADLVVSLSRRPQNSFPDLTSDPRG